MVLEQSSYPVWLRHTNKDGKTWVSDHRVWHKERFIEGQQRIAKREGGTVEQITRVEHDAERRLPDGHRRAEAVAAG